MNFQYGDFVVFRRNVYRYYGPTCEMPDWYAPNRQSTDHAVCSQIRGWVDAAKDDLRFATVEEIKEYKNVVCINHLDFLESSDDSEFDY
jgi:hypothetical protein